MGIMGITIYSLLYLNLFVIYDINKFVFVKIGINNVFVYFNELYFLPVEINGLMNEIIVANDIFSI